MGINGLTSFMYKEYSDDIFENLKLKNCILLVDGYSLLYKVHSLNSLQSSHGGNYDELANKISEYLIAFKKCNIEAIFLLDGGRDKLDRKFQTTLKRANQRLHEVCSLNTCSNTGNNSKKAKFSKINLESIINSGNYRIFTSLLPIMSFKIYFDLLKKYDFIYYQCCFEADYDLVCLANELKCPLLSCDSDFFVYDLKYGYITFDFFDCVEISETPESNEPNQEFYLPAKLYRIDAFIDYFNSKIDKCSNDSSCLKKEMLSIFAVLCGNDYVEKSIFSSLLSTFDSTNNNLKFRKLKRNATGFAKRKTSLYNRLLDWLAKFKNKNECLEMILKFVKLDKHEFIKKVVDESINEYMCHKPSFVNYYKKMIDNRFENRFTQLSLNDGNEFDSIITNDLTTFDGKLLDKEFLRHFLHCKLYRFFLDILIHRKIIFSCQIEVAEWPSSYLSSYEIRKFFYTILLKAFGNDLINASKDPIIIKEYLRYQNDIKIYDLNLTENNDFYLSFDLSKIDSIFIYNNLFRFDPIIISNLLADNHLDVKMCNKLKYLFSILYFWLNSGKTNEEFKELNNLKNENFLKAFILSIIKSSIIDPCYFKIKNENIKENDQNKSIRFYESNQSLINDYLSNKQDFSNDNFCELKNFILSESNNFSYIKDIRFKLNSFSTINTNMSSNIANKPNSSKTERLIDLKIVHCLCEFQAIYLSIDFVFNLLNVLKGNLNDFVLLNLNNFFNGTFLQNFKEELDHRVNPDLYIEEVLGRKSLFKKLYYELHNWFNSVFQLEAIQIVQTSSLTPCVVSDSSTNDQLSKKQKKNQKKNLKKKEKKMQENLNKEI